MAFESGDVHDAVGGKGQIGDTDPAAEGQGEGSRVIQVDQTYGQVGQGFGQTGELRHDAPRAEGRGIAHQHRGAGIEQMAADGAHYRRRGARQAHGRHPV